MTLISILIRAVVCNSDMEKESDTPETTSLPTLETPKLDTTVRAVEAHTTAFTYATKHVGDGVADAITNVLYGDDTNIEPSLAGKTIELKNRITNAILGSIEIPDPDSPSYTAHALANIFHSDKLKALLDELDTDSTEMRTWKQNVSNQLREELGKLQKGNATYDNTLKQWEDKHVLFRRKEQHFVTRLKEMGINYMPSGDPIEDRATLKELRRTSRGKITFNKFMASKAMQKLLKKGVDRHARVTTQLKTLRVALNKKDATKEMKAKAIKELDRDTRVHIIKESIRNGVTYTLEDGSTLTEDNLDGLRRVAHAAFKAADDPIFNTKPTGRVANIKAGGKSIVASIRNNTFALTLAGAEAAIAGVAAVVDYLQGTTEVLPYATEASGNLNEPAYNAALDDAIAASDDERNAYAKVLEGHTDLMNNTHFRNRIAKIGELYQKAFNKLGAIPTPIQETEKLRQTLDTGDIPQWQLNEDLQSFQYAEWETVRLMSYHPNIAQSSQEAAQRYAAW